MNIEQGTRNKEYRMMKDKNGAIHSIGVRNSLFNIQHSSPFYIGTSGYRYDEWIGSFYRAQQHTSGRSVETDALALYQQHFSFLEISESYGSEPVRHTYRDLERRSGSAVRFSVRVHHSITRRADRDVTRSRAMLNRHIEAAGPLIESGKFFSFLIALDREEHHSLVTLDYLVGVADVALRRRLDVHIEFRHASWHRRAVLQTLKDYGIGIGNVELPPLPRVFPLKPYVTSDKAYIRFVGRNPESWLRDDGDESPRRRVRSARNRYAYDYSCDELSHRAEIIETMARKAGMAAVVFANYTNGYAPHNALEMMRLLEKRRKVLTGKGC